jgi:hypothetical protein
LALSLDGLKLPSIASVYIVLGKGLCGRVYRWLILSLTAYLIAHWSYLHTQVASPPDWGQAAQTAKEVYLSPNSRVSSFT